MKPGIQKRMDDAIANTTLYNELFDLIVTTTETSFSETATELMDNCYRVTYDNKLEIIITCNDNVNNTLSVSVNYTPASQHIADFGISITGNLEETYHTVPRAVRSALFGYADDIAEALDSFIDENNQSNNNNTGE